MIKLAFITLIVATVFTTCPNDEFCVSCGDNNRCLQCVNAYIDDNGVCQKGNSEIVKNCYSFATQITCGICNEGYYVLNGLCAEIPIDKCGVAEFNENNVLECMLCSNGKIPVSGKCDGETDCSIDNCKYCHTATECGYCDSGYSINDTAKCTKNIVDDCISVIGDPLCSTCGRGYFMALTECKKTDVQGSSVILSAFVSLIAALKLFA